MSNQIEQENLNDMENLNKIAVNFVDELFGKFEEEDSNQLPEEQNNSSATPVDIDHKENKNEKSQKSKQNSKTIAKDKIRKAYIPPKPQTSAKKKTIKNRNNDDINDKNYYTEQNQKGNYLKQSQKRMNKKKERNEDSNGDYSPNHYNTNIPTKEIYKAKQVSTKEKKLYEERVKILRNHINALRKQEIELNKKAELAKEKEINKNKLKQEKDHLKQVLLTKEMDRRNALEEKKKIIMQQKIKNDMHLKEQKQKMKNDKLNKYKKVKNDLKKAEERRNENNNKKEHIIHDKIEEIRNERQKMRERSLQRRCVDKNRINKSYQMTYEDNINQTQKLKDELSRLENMEDQYIENIKKTQEFIRKTNDKDNIRINNFRKIKFNSLSNNNYSIYYKQKVRPKSTATSVKRRNKNINRFNQIMQKKGFSNSLIKYY
jgi:hypothetical protein